MHSRTAFFLLLYQNRKTKHFLGIQQTHLTTAREIKTPYKCSISLHVQMRFFNNLLEISPDYGQKYPDSIKMPLLENSAAKCTALTFFCKLMK